MRGKGLMVTINIRRLEWTSSISRNLKFEKWEFLTFYIYGLQFTHRVLSKNSLEFPRSFQSENGDSIVQIVVFERFDFSGKFPEETLFILREQK